MSEYGFLTEPGEEILEEAAMPSTLVQGGVDPLAEPWQIFELGTRRLRMRLEDALQFVELAAASSGPCRCSYAPDPNCLICRAKSLLAAWDAEDKPREGLPV